MLEAFVFSALMLEQLDAFMPWPQFSYDRTVAAYRQSCEDLSELQRLRPWIQWHSAWRLDECDALIREAESVHQVLYQAAKVVGYFASGVGEGECELNVEMRDYYERFDIAEDLRERIGDDAFRYGWLPLPLSWR